MGFFSSKKNKEANSLETATVSAVKLDLMKDRYQKVNKICLDKGLAVKARVAVILDYSGSFCFEYQSGVIQEVVERLLPIGLKFDDDKAIDMFIFSGENNHHELPQATRKNFEGYVDREIVAKYSMGGTSYAPVMQRVIKKYTEEPGEPAFIIYITDGSSNDAALTESVIKEASDKAIFWQFVGVGGAGMAFLESLDDMEGRVVDNADFMRIVDIKSETDENLYDKLMNEFPGWLTQAKKKNIL